jgi:Putative prokaryotic signal transducing protein
MALVELGRFSNPEAHMLIAKLESEGIMAFAFDAGTNIAEGAAFVIPVRVMVDDDDLTDARRVRDAAA